jgi:Na+/proline symporter
MDEDTARRRLLIYTLVRFGGLAIFFVGIATMYTKLLRPGGWPQAGAIIAIAGVIVSLLAPRLIKKRWDEREH